LNDFCFLASFLSNNYLGYFCLNLQKQINVKQH
jgi:hypothetical protein